MDLKNRHKPFWGLSLALVALLLWQTAFSFKHEPSAAVKSLQPVPKAAVKPSDKLDKLNSQLDKDVEAFHTRQQELDAMAREMSTLPQKSDKKGS